METAVSSTVLVFFFFSFFLLLLFSPFFSYGNAWSTPLLKDLAIFQSTFSASHLTKKMGIILHVKESPADMGAFCMLNKEC